MLKFSTANVNGVGAGSVNKLQRLKHHIRTTKRPITFIQELKVKSFSIAFREIFSEPMFTIFHTHIGQGAMIIIYNELLPNEFFTLNYTHSLSVSTIHQMLEIVDINGVAAKFSHIYQSPSQPVPPQLFTEIDDFSPDFALGDPNLTVHGQKFTDWLNKENSMFSQNIVDFKTFRSHRTRELTTTPDGIFPKAELIPSIIVHDSGVIYSDHVRIDVSFASKLFFPPSNDTPVTKVLPKYNFDSKSAEISKIWNNLPVSPKFPHVRENIRKIAEIAKIRSKPRTSPPITLPAESNEAAIEQINTKFTKFTEKINAAKDLGKTWHFIKKNAKDTSSSPNSVKIARNKQKSSFSVLKLKLSRDRTLPLTQIQHDKGLKVKRILKNYKKYYKKLSFDQVAFTKEELSNVLDGLNTASAAGPDCTTCGAYPKKTSKNWHKILYAINDQLFNAPKILLPPWSKQARLVQVPKPDGSGKLRPISILNFLACIIDRLKQNRLDTLIHADPDLRNRFGFIRKRNCEDVVGAILDEVESDQKSKLMSCLIQLDLSSAYDLVSFANVIIALDIFLRRNKAHLTQPHLLLFVYDWCKNRKILFENTSFCPANGLPQGAPLSTSLFVIVFNYFPKKSDSKDDPTISAFFFADDLGLKIAAKTLELLQITVKSAINEFKNWCESNDMILNAKKSKILWFCSSELDIGEEIESVDSVRVLGVIFDRKLNFSKHVSSIVDYCKKVRAPLYYLQKMGLNDSLCRQFVLGARAKFCFGLYWQAKIAKVHQNTLETWWTNLLRTWLGARRRLSREFVFQAAGLPKIRDFSTYLLLKRSFFQKQKNLESYPTPSIPNSLEIISKTRTRDHAFDRDTRPKTRVKTDVMDLDVWERNHGSASAWLTSTLRSNQSLVKKLEKCDEWPDTDVRKALDAYSIKLKYLWPKSYRIGVFERETRAIPENVQSTAI